MQALGKAKRKIDEAGDNMEGKYGLVSDSQGDARRPQTPLGHLNLLQISCALMGTAFSESFFIAYLGPYSAELGVKFSTYVWLLVPLTSILIQPFVGAWSDRCRWKAGRRRPYLLLGTIILALGQLMVGISEEMGYYFSKEPFSIFLFSLIILNIGLSIQQVSLRALWADVVPAEQLSTIFASGTFFQLGGYMLGYAATEVKWADTHFFDFLKTSSCNGKTLCFDVRIVSVMLASVSWLTNILVLLSSIEPIVAVPMAKGWFSGIFNVIAGFKDCLSSLFVRRVVECTFWSWMAWWLFNMFIVHFTAKELFLGVADAPTSSIQKKQYDEGVHFASGSLFLSMIVGWITAVFVPIITRVTGKSAAWLSSFLFTAGLLLLGVKVSYSPHRLGTALWIAGFGVPFAFQITIPFILVLEHVELVKSTGVLIALLTMAIAVAQLVIASCGTMLRDTFGTDLAPFALGAFFFVVASIRCSALTKMEQDRNEAGGDIAKQTIEMTANKIGKFDEEDDDHHLGHVEYHIDEDSDDGDITSARAKRNESDDENNAQDV